jgi:hypothetical protein
MSFDSFRPIIEGTVGWDSIFIATKNKEFEGVLQSIRTLLILID